MFHPELTSGMLRGWLGNGGAELPHSPRNQPGRPGPVRSSTRSLTDSCSGR